MWLYLAGNEDGYSFEFSPEDFMKRTGCTKTPTYDAINLLKKLGYIIQEDNRYMSFYTWPHLEVAIPGTFLEFLNLKNEDKIKIYKVLKDKNRNSEEEQMYQLCISNNLVR